MKKGKKIGNINMILRCRKALNFGKVFQGRGFIRPVSIGKPLKFLHFIVNGLTMKRYILLIVLILLLIFPSVGYCATYTSQYPPAHSDTYVKATTKANTDYWAYFATDPALPLTGNGNSTTWLSLLNNVTNQRFHIDLGSAKIIRRIYYENFHSAGIYLTRGAKNFTFWGSNTAGSFAELTYTTDTGWTELTVAQNTFDQHSAVDESDPKYITVTNSTEYRYYAFKFADNWGATYLGVSRIELQTEDVGVPSVTTSAATNVEATTATLNGNITYNGGATITERGFYCDTNESPTTKYTVAGTSTGAFTKDMTDLAPNVKYYFKAFATNSVGTSYGSILNFTTGAKLRTVDPEEEKTRRTRELMEQIGDYLYGKGAVNRFQRYYVPKPK